MVKSNTLKPVQPQRSPASLVALWSARQRQLAAMAVSLSLLAGCGAAPVLQDLDSLAQTNKPEDDATVKMTYYTITGSTAQELREQMNAVGPTDSNANRRFDARTDWYVRWNYRYESRGGNCQITTAQVKTEVTILMPQWHPSSEVSQALVQRWQRYITALKAHEDGHKDHGLNAGREILSKLQGFSAYPTCPELESAANQAARSIIQRYNQKDITYDQTTGHGASQGATFP
ncbi:hypothetical protein BST81_15355 [Leptolyngbya sp. 'hensonii']|uniref:DUF922 domain-containing Zn-dependent protease n=1 Tax=Leptolyngbya sp. 'hensonii' TaxID=1922337 RepID=UPI0009607860|nr:DUF922 domain-containing Zn-dependent protease [Leptolyngbya sp. 'hensonii']OLP17694.1 hypothetical protein BST81_15355 [Leptolyngbya sp. 'hensonii']